MKKPQVDRLIAGGANAAIDCKNKQQRQVVASNGKLRIRNNRTRGVLRMEIKIETAGVEESDLV